MHFQICICLAHVFAHGSQKLRVESTAGARFPGVLGSSRTALTVPVSTSSAASAADRNAGRVIRAPKNLDYFEGRLRISPA